jgi:hypothetical protein
MNNTFTTVLVCLLLGTGVVAAKDASLTPPIVKQGDQTETAMKVEAEVLRELRELEGKVRRLRAGNSSLIERINTLEEARKSLPSNLPTKKDLEALIAKAILASDSQVNVALGALQGVLTANIEALAAEVDELKNRADASERHDKWQDVRITALEDGSVSQSSMSVRFSAVGCAVPGPGHFCGYGTAGVSKTFGTNVLDVEALIGGTQEAFGLLVGGRGAYLVGFNENVRGGVGAEFTMNYGNSLAAVGPEFDVELGPMEANGLIGIVFPHIIADPTGETGWTAPKVKFGFGGRF